MASHNELGHQAEDEALTHLLSKGLKLLEKNWRFGKEEIDLILEDEAHIVIVEVKARTNDAFGSPEEFVTKAKQRHLITAANAYAEQHNIQKEMRFDIVSVLMEPSFQLEHIPDAFYPY